MPAPRLHPHQGPAAPRRSPTDHNAASIGVNAPSSRASTSIRVPIPTNKVSSPASTGDCRDWSPRPRSPMSKDDSRLVDAQTVAVGDRIDGPPPGPGHGIPASDPRPRDQRPPRRPTRRGLTELPERVVVLSEGVIGVEFASVFASFGCPGHRRRTLDRLVPAEAASAPSSPGLPQAQDHRPTGARFSRATQSWGRRLVTLGTARPSSRPARGRRARSVKRSGLRGGPASSWIAGSSPPTAAAQQCRERVCRGRPRPRPPVGHRGFAQHLVAEGSPAHPPTPVDDTLIPKVTSGRPEIASVGLRPRRALRGIRRRGADL